MLEPITTTSSASPNDVAERDDFSSSSTDDEGRSIDSNNYDTANRRRHVGGNYNMHHAAEIYSRDTTTDLPSDDGHGDQIHDDGSLIMVDDDDDNEPPTMSSSSSPRSRLMRWAVWPFWRRPDDTSSMVAVDSSNKATEGQLYQLQSDAPPPDAQRKPNPPSKMTVLDINEGATDDQPDDLNEYMIQTSGRGLSKRFLLWFMGFIWVFNGAQVGLTLFTAQQPPRFPDCELILANHQQSFPQQPGGVAPPPPPVCNPLKPLSPTDCTTPYVYVNPKSVSIISSFKVPPLTCEPRPWKNATLVQMLFFLGVLIGAWGLGTFADIFGRSKIVILGLVICAVAGTLGCFTPTLFLYGLSRMGVGMGAAGSATASFILASEITPQSMRHKTTIYQSVAFCIGGVLTALFASIIPNWRLLTALVTMPGNMFFMFCCCYSRLNIESPQWLLSQNRYSEAYAAWDYVYKENNPKEELSSVITLDEFTERATPSRHLVVSYDKQDSVLETVTTFPTGPWLIAHVCLWFSTAFVYYGIFLDYESLVYSALHGGSTSDHRLLQFSPHMQVLPFDSRMGVLHHGQDRILGSGDFLDSPPAALGFRGTAASIARFLQQPPQQQHQPHFLHYSQRPSTPPGVHLLGNDSHEQASSLGQANPHDQESLHDQANPHDQESQNDQANPQDQESQHEPQLHDHQMNLSRAPPGQEDPADKDKDDGDDEEESQQEISDTAYNGGLSQRAYEDSWGQVAALLMNSSKDIYEHSKQWPKDVKSFVNSLNTTEQALQVYSDLAMEFDNDPNTNPMAPYFKQLRIECAICVVSYLVEMPASLCAVLMSNCYFFGRKRTVGTLLLLSSITATASYISKKASASGFLYIGLAVGARLAVSANFMLMYLYSSESFPTSTRGSILGLCSASARIGAALSAPLGALLNSLDNGAALLSFGIVTALALVNSMPLILDSYGHPLYNNLTMLKAARYKELRQLSERRLFRVYALATSLICCGCARVCTNCWTMGLTQEEKDSILTNQTGAKTKNIEMSSASVPTHKGRRHHRREYRPQHNLHEI